MSVIIKVEGLRELDAALGELSKATAKSVLLRVLKKAGQPIADAAKNLARRDTGELRESIQVSTKHINKVGNAEFSAAMKTGLGKEAAVSALRGARRAANGQGSFAEVFVGPANAKNKKDAIKRWVNEYGSVNISAQPYMRPAWDGNKDGALRIISTDIGAEIIATANRAAKRKAAKIARGG